MANRSLALRTLVAGVAVGLFAAIESSGATLPKEIDSPACTKAPMIDGVIGADEWKEARIYPFDMAVVRFDPNAKEAESRACKFWVMNSANALYLALQVPDATVDDSVSPLVMDIAILAFSHDSQVRPGDDRKAIARGVYRDKHVDVPGKGDKDDRKQDGRGVMERADGICSFEWAVPLGQGDADDLQAKPGDVVRWNVAYFDAFQFPLTKTRLGGTYGPQLDRAGAWGTLHLASNVKDDGGLAFEGPGWIKPLLRPAEAEGSPPARLQIADTAAVPGSGAAKALLAFHYHDERGAEKDAKAKIFVPERAKGGARVPLLFAAGYELPDGGEQPYLRRGWAVASPRDLPANPLIRMANPDIALLHAVRALPFVDDARVVIAGGSAGGYMTLMLAAETFPLAGAMPDVPPVNWGYNAAYFFKQKADGTLNAKLPALLGVAGMLEACRTVYGSDYDDPVWYAHSPLAHVPTITCPVSVYWTTADMLVPINQVGKRWVQPFDKGRFPEGFTMEPSRLMKGSDGQRTLVDVLPADEFELFPLTVPASAPGKPAVVALPMSAERPWSIGILDEGPPEPGLAHRKTGAMLDRGPFLDRVTTGPIAASQLTAAKLERLMDRYAGREWLPSRLAHLDEPASERADVLRGLRTYVGASRKNARTFAELYAQLPERKRVLEAATVRALSGNGGPG